MSENVALQLDKRVKSLTLNKDLDGFAKASEMAKAMTDLSSMLDDDYMKPIMALQGNGLGFKTDKDKTGGYDVPEVRNCLIEAVLRGVQPIGNHFNIIAGNCYITKEGFGYLLNNVKDLKWKITPGLPRISGESAAIVMNIKWKEGKAEEQEEPLDVTVKVNKFMGSDAVIGKATRKARAWLYNTLSNIEINDGDTEDVPFVDVTNQKPSVAEKSEKASESLSGGMTSSKGTGKQQQVDFK